MRVVFVPCSGQCAALAGGTTFHIDFSLPKNGDIAAGFERYKEVSKSSVMDHSFHMAVTTWSDKVTRFVSRPPIMSICNYRMAIFGFTHL